MLKKGWKSESLKRMDWRDGAILPSLPPIGEGRIPALDLWGWLNKQQWPWTEINSSLVMYTHSSVGRTLHSMQGYTGSPSGIEWTIKDSGRYIVSQDVYPLVLLGECQWIVKIILHAGKKLKTATPCQTGTASGPGIRPSVWGNLICWSRVKRRSFN